MQELFGAGIGIPVKLLRDTSWRTEVYEGREGAARIWKGEGRGEEQQPGWDGRSVAESLNLGTTDVLDQIFSPHGVGYTAVPLTSTH